MKTGEMTVNVETYLHGDCHIFAEALHQVFGYSVQWAIDMEDEELQDEVLVHAFCYQGDKVIDVRGIRAFADVLEPFDYNEVYYRDIHAGELEDFLDAGFVHRPEPGQLADVIRLIQANKERYLIQQDA